MYEYVCLKNYTTVTNQSARSRNSRPFTGLSNSHRTISYIMFSGFWDNFWRMASVLLYTCMTLFYNIFTFNFSMRFAKPLHSSETLFFYPETVASVKRKSDCRRCDFSAVFVTRTSVICVTAKIKIWITSLSGIWSSSMSWATFATNSAKSEHSKK